MYILIIYFSFHLIYHQCLVNIFSIIIIIIVTSSHSHCIYISIILVALYISSLLIHKYHHSPIHSLNLPNLVNSCFVVYSKRSQFITLSSYLCISFSFFFEIESLQPYPSSLMHRGLISLLCIFTIFYMGCCISILLTGVELHCTSLLHWDSFWAS